MQKKLKEDNIFKISKKAREPTSQKPLYLVNTVRKIF